MRCSGQLCNDILHHSCQRPDTCTYRYNYGDGRPRSASTPPSASPSRRAPHVRVPSDGVFEGDDAATGQVQTTRLLQSRQNPTFYYVPFTGVTVGTRRLRIPLSAFALRPDGSGGVIVDSGTALTLFPAAVLTEVLRAFRAQLRLPFTSSSSPDDGVCFATPMAAGGRRASAATVVSVPRMAFHFQGADLELPRRNYVLDDPRRGSLCILLADSGDSGATIGNFVQQDMRVLYDLEAETCQPAPAQC
ncbi:hypothetical protein ZWY2020_059569 [Hordeum vulgare]|nr:hypothetical protein ZWY2020_059569 [Hordeum vulgare]